jgi:hypothetical protein
MAQTLGSWSSKRLKIQIKCIFANPIKCVIIYIITKMKYGILKECPKYEIENVTGLV